MAKLTLDSGEYDNGLDDAKGKAEGFGGKLKSAAKVGAAALATATTAVTAFAGESVKVGANFDASMSQVAATMGVTVDEIEKLREFAQEMGSSTAFSASQAADALNFMALAGYDAETSMEMLPNVLNLAAAGGIELAAASDMVTDASSALGLSLDETSELVDKMATASSKSNTSVAQLGDAILTVGGTAKTLAGGTTELSAALGILADNGIKGAEGGTALRNVILALSAPTDTAAKKMAELGLEAYDADGNLRPLEDIFLDLNGVLSDMTQGEQTDALNTLFNKVDLKSANALLATSAERWDELSDAINDASGAAQQMADTQLDNLAGDITLFQSALEGAQIAISDGLTPTLREFVQFGADGLGRLTTAFQADGVAGAMDELGTILSDGIDMLMDMLPTLVEAGASLLGSLAEGIIKNLPKMVEGATEIILTLANGIAENLPELIPTIVDVVLQIVDTLTSPDTVTRLVGAALSIIVALADGLMKAMPQLLEAVPEIIGNLITAIIGAMPQFVIAGYELLTALIADLPDIIAKIMTFLPSLLSEIITGLIDSVPLIIEAGVELLTAIVDDLPTIITNIVAAIPHIIMSIVETLIKNLGKIIESGIKLIVALAEGMIKAIPQLLRAIPQIIIGIVQGFVGAIDEFINVGKRIVEGVWDGIKSMATWITDKVKGFFTGIVDGIKGLLGIHSPSTVFAGIGKNMALGIGEGFDKAMAGVGRDIDSRLDFGVRTMDLRTNTFGYGDAPARDGGTVVNVTVDPATIKDFTQFLDMMNNAKRLGRMYA